MVNEDSRFTLLEDVSNVQKLYSAEVPQTTSPVCNKWRQSKLQYEPSNLIHTGTKVVSKECVNKTHTSSGRRTEASKLKMNDENEVHISKNTYKEMKSNLQYQSSLKSKLKSTLKSNLKSTKKNIKELNGCGCGIKGTKSISDKKKKFKQKQTG